MNITVKMIVCMALKKNNTDTHTKSNQHTKKKQKMYNMYLVQLVELNNTSVYRKIMHTSTFDFQCSNYSELH